jgi:three-Cys-motif partner protein
MEARRPARIDTIGKWSEEKLDLLHKYLSAYARIMNSQKKTWLAAYHYIDAFAGAGKALAKDAERYIQGSPVRALQSEPLFDGYWFIERSPRRVGQLQALQRQFPQRKVTIQQGDCNEILRNTLVPEINYPSRQRGLVFLDPYGLQVEWETVQLLAEAKTFDVFVNFSLMAVIRLLKLNEPPKKQVAALLDRIMGNTEWVQEVYRPPAQLSLFGDQPFTRDAIPAEWLARLYADQISSLFPFVSKPVIMTNSRNAPLYALFLASHNRRGVEIAHDIFKRYERLRELGR